MTDKHIDGFEDRLQKAIGAMDMTYSEVCRKTGIGQSCMNGYINYGMMPNCLNLVRLSKLLGVSTDYLLGLEGE